MHDPTESSFSRVPLGASLRGILRLSVASCAFATLAGCGGGHELQRYDFAGRTLAIADYPAPAPVLRTGSLNVDTDNVITAVVDGGSRVAKEIEARRVRALLDSVASTVDITPRLSERLLERAARYLGTRPVVDAASADYVLEAYITSVGIDAVGNRPARVFMNVDAVLIDRASGHEVWSVEVSTHDRLTPSVTGGGAIPIDIVTAATLRGVTAEQIELAFVGLVDFTADFTTNELRESLRKLRR